MKKISKYALIGLVLMSVIGGVFYFSQDQEARNKKFIPGANNSEYSPEINPNNFVATVNNKYFTLKPGTKFTYENKTDEGLERIEVVVTDKIKLVMGINAAVVWDRAWLNGELIEDTKDWYAQDKKGNVWYLGESVDNYVQGKLDNHAGSWEAGVDDAKPGIIMLNNPQIGNSYRQEYYKGQAEDMGEIVALGIKITVPYGTFENCLQTRDWSALEKSQGEFKYYCPDVGLVVMEESVAGEQEKVELINVSSQ